MADMPEDGTAIAVVFDDLIRFGSVTTNASVVKFFADNAFNEWCDAMLSRRPYVRDSLYRVWFQFANSDDAAIFKLTFK
jgi:hypothetical protein